MGKKNKGGRPRLFHRDITFKLGNEDLLDRYLENQQENTAIRAVGRFAGTIAIDSTLLVMGYILGAKYNLGIPGSVLWQQVGIPSFETAVAEAKDTLRASEQLLDAKERSFQKVIDDGNIPVLEFRDLKACGLSLTEEDIAAGKRCVHLPGLSKLSVTVERLRARLAELQQLQGIIMALFVFIIGKHLGGIVQGIGGIIPG